MLNAIYDISEAVKQTLESYNLQEELEDLIVAIYGSTRGEFDPVAYTQMVEHLKESLDYSIMNMNNACVFAALLLIRYDYPFSKVTKLRSAIEKIRSAGYRSRVSNYMAYELLEEEVIDDDLSKSAIIYQHMQEVHGFLTGEDDFLAAVYLSQLDETPEKIGVLVEENYKVLARNGFKKGNALQNLSHYTSYVGKGDSLAYLDKVCLINKLFQEHKIKLNSSQYIIYGLVGLIVDEPLVYMDYLSEQIGHYKFLMETKRLRTLQMNMVVIESLRNYQSEQGRDFGDILTLRDDGILAGLLLLMLNYIFRERLL